MDEKLNVLHELCDALSDELADVNMKIRKADGMSAGDLEAVDKLSHALKSIKTTIAMMEADGGYSGGYMPHMGTYTDNRGMSYRGRSYAARRDSMGRYSRRGYSYADGMDELIDEMDKMLPGLSDEKRRKAEDLMRELRG